MRTVLDFGKYLKKPIEVIGGIEFNDDFTLSIVQGAYLNLGSEKMPQSLLHAGERTRRGGRTPDALFSFRLSLFPDETLDLTD